MFAKLIQVATSLTQNLIFYELKFKKLKPSSAMLAIFAAAKNK